MTDQIDGCIFKKACKCACSFTLGEIIFMVVLSAMLGVVWWAYSLFYNIMVPILKPLALDGAICGFWQIGGVFFAYVLRKPGSALFGELIASTVEGLISQWGVSSIIYGLVQGLGAEVIFLMYGYKKFNKTTASYAGFLSGLLSYLLTYYWYNYHALGATFNIINLATNSISGAILGGLLAVYLANCLLKTGVLNQFKISATSGL